MQKCSTPSPSTYQCIQREVHKSRQLHWAVYSPPELFPWSSQQTGGAGDSCHLPHTVDELNTKKRFDQPDTACQHAVQTLS